MLENLFLWMNIPVGSVPDPNDEGSQQGENPPSPDPGYSRRQRIGLVVGLLVLPVLALAPAPQGMEPAAWNTAVVGLLMALWWMTEALPIPVTAMLPLVLFPMLGVASIREVAAPYAHPLIFLFLGGFLIALGMERWQLHRRLALNIIKRVGTRPSRIVAGFMIASAFLSMWISNTATAMMMLPIGISVITLVSASGASGKAGPGRDGNFTVCLMLAIAYACSLGGTGTLIGTPPNALFAGFMEETYGVDISFSDWFRISLPLLFLGLPLVFVLLTKLIYPIRIRNIPGGRELIMREAAKLGAITRPEITVAVVFALTAGLWIFRPLLARLIPNLSDTGIALFGALLLFIVPVDWKQGIFALEWKEAKRLPWGVLLLFGGGLSLASTINRTGLAAWIGNSLSGLDNWPVLLLTALVIGIIIMLTELTSNTATTATFLPILASIAVGLGQNPLLLAVPATLAASCAFMLPVATPPNAIVYGSGYLSVPQMARAGIFLNLLFLILITAAAYFLLPWAFGLALDTTPPWAQ